MSNEPKDSEKKPFEWTPETIRIVLDGLEKLADKYLLFRERESTHDDKYVEITSKHDRRVIYGLLTFLSALIIGMAWLTYVEKVSGEALLFAVGIIIGYIFALIQRFIFGSQKTVTENPET